MFKFLSMFVLVGLIACNHSSNNGGSSSSPTPPLNSLNYLVQGDGNLGLELPKPPVPGSSADEQELTDILNLQKTRTTTDCTRGNTEVTINLANFYGPPYGPLTTAEVKKLEAFFDKVYSDTNWVVGPAKTAFGIPRPYLEDSQIKPCLPLETSKSYPSGHATASRVFANVLALLKPSMKTTFFNRADQIAEDRVVGGVHRPDEIDAGKSLGDTIFQNLEKSSEFMAGVAQLQGTL